MTTVIVNRAKAAARQFATNREGTVAMEYALLAAALAIAVAACVVVLGAPLGGIYDYIKNAIGGL